MERYDENGNFIDPLDMSDRLKIWYIKDLNLIDDGEQHNNASPFFLHDIDAIKYAVANGLELEGENTKLDYIQTNTYNEDLVQNDINNRNEGLY